MNSRLYAILKSIAQVWLPALGTLVVTVQAIWGFTQVDAAHIVATIMAVDTFLGVGLGLASATGQGLDGHVVVDNSDPEKQKVIINVDTDLDKLGGRNELRLKVKPPNDSSVFTLVNQEARPPADG